MQHASTEMCVSEFTWILYKNIDLCRYRPETILVGFKKTFPLENT